VASGPMSHASGQRSLVTALLQPSPEKLRSAIRAFLWHSYMPQAEHSKTKSCSSRQSRRGYIRKRHIHHFIGHIGRKRGTCSRSRGNNLNTSIGIYMDASERFETRYNTHCLSLGIYVYLFCLFVFCIINLLILFYLFIYFLISF